MRASFIFLVLALSGVYAFDTKKIVSSTTVSSKDTDTVKADVKNATVKPNVGPVAPKTSTAAPEVTTVEASNTTTHNPTSTTPTPVPAPVPDPKIGRWSINNTDAIIVLRMAAQLDIAYNATSQLSIKKKINIPDDKNATKVSGNFEKNNEKITISWKAVNASGENSVALNFTKNEQSKTYTLGSIKVIIDASELPGLNSSLELEHSKEHFNTTLGHSYRCAKLQNFNLTISNNSTQNIGQLKVTDFQFQAFKDDMKNNFGLAEDCPLDTSDVVPIAVGCVLAGLVVIVLVAYLISRRRSQAQGYVSM